jgi:hypothetical protein
MIPAHKNVLTALGIVLFIIMGFLLFVMVYYRKSKILKSIQINMQYLILTGGFIGAARVITGQLPVSHDRSFIFIIIDIFLYLCLYGWSIWKHMEQIFKLLCLKFVQVRIIINIIIITIINNSCSLNTWFGHLAFWLIYCSMLSKTWRVHKIVNNKTLKRVKVSENFILFSMTIAMVFLIVYLALLEGLTVFSAQMVTTLTTEGLQSYSEDHCVRKLIGNLSYHLIIVLEQILLYDCFYLFLIKKLTYYL